jgi:hypothetical protein
MCHAICYSQVDKSYKKECQEKNLPHRLNTAPFLSRHSAHCLSVRSSLGPSPLFRLRVRSVDTLPPPCGVLFPVVTVPIVSETTSLMVVHCMSGNAWSYWRLVAYGFIRLSEEA